MARILLDAFPRPVVLVRQFPAHATGRRLLSSIFELAEAQYGVFSRAQARAAGLNENQIERRIRTGIWERVLPGVYRIPGSPVTGRQRAMAACLWLGDEALVSHMTAATLLRLDGCNTRELHMTVPNDIRRRAAEPSMVVHRVQTLARQDRVVVDGLRCTSATRTLIDCAARLNDEASEVAFESARRMGLTSVRALAERASSVLEHGRPGARALRELLAHQRPGDPALQYRLEVKTARLLRDSDLPRPARQVPVGRYRVDFGLAGPVGVECEGFEYHGNRLQWKRDKRRTAWIEAQGWDLVFVTWDHVTTRPEETLLRIRLALARTPNSGAYDG